MASSSSSHPADSDPLHFGSSTDLIQSNSDSDHYMDEYLGGMSQDTTQHYATSSSSNAQLSRSDSSDQLVEMGQGQQHGLNPFAFSFAVAPSSPPFSSTSTGTLPVQGSATLPVQGSASSSSSSSSSSSASGSPVPLLFLAANHTDDPLTDSLLPGPAILPLSTQTHDQHNHHQHPHHQQQGGGIGSPFKTSSSSSSSFLSHQPMLDFVEFCYQKSRELDNLFNQPKNATWLTGILSWVISCFKEFPDPLWIRQTNLGRVLIESPFLRMHPDGIFAVVMLICSVSGSNSQLIVYQLLFPPDHVFDCPNGKLHGIDALWSVLDNRSNFIQALKVVMGEDITPRHVFMPASFSLPFSSLDAPPFSSSSSLSSSSSSAYPFSLPIFPPPPPPQQQLAHQPPTFSRSSRPKRSYKKKNDNQEPKKNDDQEPKKKQKKTKKNATSSSSSSSSFTSSVFATPFPSALASMSSSSSSSSSSTNISFSMAPFPGEKTSLASSPRVATLTPSPTLTTTLLQDKRETSKQATGSSRKSLLPSDKTTLKPNMSVDIFKDQAIVNQFIARMQRIFMQPYVELFIVSSGSSSIVLL